MIKNDKKYLSERGRSIIEMIAVVVSISVLTVLGLTLYWYVLNRQKTNALTGEVGSMALNTSIMLSQPDPNVQIRGNLEYPYTGTINDNKTFTITVSNIPGGICSLLKADKWSLPYETKFNGDIYGECQNENEIAFSFHNSLYDGAHPELEQEQEEPEQKINYCRPACRAGCKETCKTNQYWCWEDGCACLNGKANPPQCNQDPPCTQEPVEIHGCEGNSFTCCPDFYICEEPVCESEENTCSVDVITVHNCDGTTSKCCPDNGTDCSEPTDCCQTEEDCTGTGNICVNNHCTCATGYTKDADGNCGTCPTTTVFRPTNANECNNCNTAEHPYQMKHGLCEPAPTCKNDSDCAYMYGFCINGICGCPEGYFQNKNGNCTLCTDDTAKEKETFDEECAKCNGIRKMVNGKCTLM